MTDHDFQPVAGHPDDDECTHRSDGTDATYCSLTRDEHGTDHEFCPGSDDAASVGTTRGRNSSYPGLGECRCCGLEFKLRWSDGLIRKHRRFDR